MSIFSHHPEAWDAAEAEEVGQVLESLGARAGDGQHMAELLRDNYPKAYSALVQEMGIDPTIRAHERLAGL